MVGKRRKWGGNAAHWPPKTSKCYAERRAPRNENHNLPDPLRLWMGWVGDWDGLGWVGFRVGLRMCSVVDVLGWGLVMGWVRLGWVGNGEGSFSWTS